MSRCFDFYVWIDSLQQKGGTKSFRSLICSLKGKGQKRVENIRSYIEEERYIFVLKSQSWYYKIKELSFHREWFNAKQVKNKQYPEDVKIFYKYYILLKLSNLQGEIDLEALESLGLNKFNISALPKYSVYIQIKFRLKRPYLSKDDEVFYIIDNPIVKDRAFKLPIIRSTTWKGALRYAAIKVFEDWIFSKLNNNEEVSLDDIFEERARIVKLFGSEKESQSKYLGKLCLIALEKEKGKINDDNIAKINDKFEKWLVDNGFISSKVPARSGRLFFYPTFFYKISLDVITPLDRRTKTPVRGPIYFEVVPKGSEGIFRLLYYPFDLVAQGEFKKIESETKEDLRFLEKALRKMFYEIGFSAKKTSGFGIISDFEGEVWYSLKKKKEKFRSFGDLAKKLFN